MNTAPNSPRSPGGGFGRTLSKKLSLIPSKRHSPTHATSPTQRSNPHLEPGGDTDSPMDDSSPLSNGSNDTPSRGGMIDKLGLFKRLSSEISRPFTGRKNGDDLDSSIQVGNTPKSEIVTSTPMTSRDNKDDTSPSRLFAFRRNRNSIDTTSCDKHTIRVDLTAPHSTITSSNSGGSEIDRLPDKHAVTDAVGKRISSSSNNHKENNCPTGESNIQKQQHQHSKHHRHRSVTRSSSDHYNKERRTERNSTTASTIEGDPSSSISARHHRSPKSGAQQQQQKLPALILIPQSAPEPDSTAEQQSGHRRHRDRQHKKSRRRSTDSNHSRCSSSGSSISKEQKHSSRHRRRSSTGRGSTGGQGSVSGRDHKDHKDKVPSSATSRGIPTGLGLPPLQSPSSRHTSTHSSTSARSTDRPTDRPEHHHQRRRRNSEISEGKPLPSPDSLHTLDHNERGCSTERVERRQHSPRGAESHRPRRNSVIKGSAVQHHLEKTQEHLHNLPSPPSTSRRRRWSISSRNDEIEGNESFRGLRRLAGSTIGRRNSTSPHPGALSTSPSPTHRKFTQSLGWLLPFKGFNKNNNNNNMGAALGNCCAGRDDENVKQKAKEKYEKTWDFLQGEQVLSDVDKFDKAYANNDIKGFVDLLNSAEPIEELPEKMHPWAADPKTVGALSTTQLAILAAKEDDPTIKDRTRDSGAIPILVKNLNSKEEDRLHASVVALSFLSVDNPRNCIEIFESGAMPMLIKGMETDIEGLRGATAQTCRNIYVLDLKYRADFKRHGGVQALVKLLDLPQGQVDAENLFNQLEAVYHLEDLILEAGEELPEYVSEVKKAGAVRRLEALIKVDNQDLTEAAQYLLVRLAD